MANFILVGERACSPAYTCVEIVEADRDCIGKNDTNETTSRSVWNWRRKRVLACISVVIVVVILAVVLGVELSEKNAESESSNK